jgi:fructokinase
VTTNLIKNSNSTVLNGRPLGRDITAVLGQPIKIENDANCLAISEAVDGAAAGAKVVFGAILGTGVGGGLVIDRQVLTGRNRIAGEWGHNPLPWIKDGEHPGHPCYCGKTGCIETFLSGAGLAREYLGRSGKALTAERIVAAAAKGDKAAAGSILTYKDRLARGLASVINVFDPDVVVLGGGLSNIEALYVGLIDLIAAYAFSDEIKTTIVKAMHGDSSGVRGAAWLWSSRG